MIPGLGRSPGEGNGNPLQYPCLENLIDRGLQSMGSQRVGHKPATEQQQSYPACTCPTLFSSLSSPLGGGCLVAKLCPTLVTPWTVARQAPLSMEFSRQGY